MGLTWKNTWDFFLGIIGLIWEKFDFNWEKMDLPAETWDLPGIELTLYGEKWVYLVFSRTKRGNIYLYQKNNVILLGTIDFYQEKQILGTIDFDQEKSVITRTI